jgi:hypothetical protein
MIDNNRFNIDNIQVVIHVSQVIITYLSYSNSTLLFQNFFPSFFLEKIISFQKQWGVVSFFNS